MHVASVTASSYVHRSYLEDLLFVFSIPSGSYILSASSAVGFFEPWGSNVMATSTLGLNVPRPLTLTPPGCGSLYLVPSASGGSSSEDE